MQQHTSPCFGILQLNETSIISKRKFNKMAVQRLAQLTRILQLGGRLWLTWFKAALCMSFVGILASVVQVSLSQSGMGSGFDDMNETNLSCMASPDMNCSDLPDTCLNCSFVFDCVYGENTTVNCTVLEEVECMGDMEFNRTFECQYCYQLSEYDTCCAPNDTCNTRSTPAGRYIANCIARENVSCLPPRQFQKQQRCNYATGFRWSTAMLLSFTLGGFGVDRFYLHLWGSAIGKLISFGGLGVWSILDIILVGTGYVGPADGSVYIY